MTKLYDVIISGAGPIGLFLACELGLAHLSVLVLERDHSPESPWKVAPLGLRGLSTVSVENFYRRGLLEELFFERGLMQEIFGSAKRPMTMEKKSTPQYRGHFAGISLDISKLDLERWRYRLPGPAFFGGATTIERVETLLTERAESLGVTVLRGSGVTKFEQDDNGVTVQVGEHQSFRGRWLLACDGARSEIRKASGIDFVGSEPKFTGYAAKCELDPPDALKRGFVTTKNGMHITALPGSLYLLDFDGGAFDRTQEVTKEHLQDVLNRITGRQDVKIKTLDLVSAFTDRAKQATTYRHGRVLLAGDSAHIHAPLGGQGMNLGLGDAMNLGWKLASTIRQELSLSSSSSSSTNTTTTTGSEGSKSLDLTLLDTYEKERHPIGASILELTRAQVSTLEPGPHGAALQELMRSLINTVDGANHFIGRIWGLSQRYDLSDGKIDAHPLVGCSAPDLELKDESRLGTVLQGGKGLLVDLKGEVVLKEAIEGGKYAERVDYRVMDVKDTRGLRAFLVRPDGVVAWAMDDEEQINIDDLRVALERWFAF